MRLAAGMLATSLALSAASCAGPASGGGSGPPGCGKLSIPPAAAGQPPPAILKDLAGPPSEYLLGSPAGRKRVMTQSLGALFTQPFLGGGRIFVSAAADAAHPRIVVLEAGGCRDIGPGVIRAVRPDGGTLVRGDGQKFDLVDTATGHSLTPVDAGFQVYTGSGSLVVAAGDTVKVYPKGSTKPAAHSLGPVAIGGALGADGVIVWPAAGTSLLDARTGEVRKLSDARLQPVAGSPDGKLIAGFDLAGGSLQLLDAQSGTSVRVPVAPRPYSLTWSPDSRWVGISTGFGGELLRVSDRTSEDLGTLVVAAW